MHDGGLMFGGFGWILWLLLIGAVVWAVLALTGTMGRSAGPQDRSKSALAILEERYARGDIDREEFEQKKADLKP